MKKTAIIYCENHFGTMDGKTANGLIRSSGKYQIVGIIDSTKAGMDSGIVLEGKENGIPMFANIEDALTNLSGVPNQFIYGIAPADAFLKENERNVILEAMEQGMNIVNPLQEFLTDDEQFVQAAILYGVEIEDVRMPPLKKIYIFFQGESYTLIHQSLLY